MLRSDVVQQVSVWVQRSRGITRTEQQVGRLLVEGGFIGKENLDDAISYAQQEGIMLRKALVAKEYIADETYSTFLSIQTRYPTGGPQAGDRVR